MSLGDALLLVFGRARLPQRSMIRGIPLLRECVEKAGIADSATLGDALYLRLVQEAYRRASEREEDRQARMRGFYREIDEVGLQLVAALRKEPTADPAIRTILEYHR